MSSAIGFSHSSLGYFTISHVPGLEQNIGAGGYLPSTSGSHLNEDVLRYIFSHLTFSYDDFSRENVNTHDDKLLITVRYASQVCSYWRSILLSYPVVWANTINFNYLQQGSDEWRNEILRRTGASLISVIYCGTNPSMTKSATSFLMSLLDVHWERIRRIEVTIPVDNTLCRDKRWLSIHRKSPNLESFCVTFPSGCQYLNGEERPLFNGSAPLLTRVIIQDIDDFAPHSFRRIEHLHLLYWTRVDMHLITGLKELLALRTLEINHPSTREWEEHREDVWETVRLPALETLILNIGMNGFSFLIYPLAPRHGFILNMKAFSGGIALSQQLSSNYQRVLDNLLKRSMVGSELNCTISGEEFQISNSLQENNRETLSWVKFELGPLGGDWDTICHMLLQAATSTFRKATTLKLKISSFNYTNSPGDQLWTLFSTLLASITKIHLDSTTLRFLHDLHMHAPDGVLLMPLLKIISFERPDYYEVPGLVVEFITHRRKISPVHIAPFSLLESTPQKEGFLFLNGIGDDHMVWSELSPI